MTVKELIKELATMNENDTVIIGVEGYTTTANSTEAPGELYIESTKSGVFITDNAYYEEVVFG